MSCRYAVGNDRCQYESYTLLYPIDGREGNVEAEAEHIPVLGFAISFPHVDFEQVSTVSYQVNNVYYQQEYGRTSWAEEDST